MTILSLPDYFPNGAWRAGAVGLALLGAYTLAQANEGVTVYGPRSNQTSCQLVTQPGRVKFSLRYCDADATRKAIEHNASALLKIVRANGESFACKFIEFEHPMGADAVASMATWGIFCDRP